MKNSFSDKLSLVLFISIFLIIGYMLFAYKTGEFEKHKSWVYSVAVNKGDTILSASENELLLWDNRHCIGRLTSHADAIKSATFSHSGDLFVSSSIDKSVKIWSLRDRKVIKTLNGHSAGVNNVAFDVFDKYIVSAGYDGKLFIWDWRNNVIVKAFDARRTEFSINESDVLVYTDTFCHLNLFDLKSLTKTKTLDNYCGIPIFHPKGYIIAVKDFYKSIFTFIDINSGKTISELNIMDDNSISEVSVFKFTPDGEFLIAAIWGGDIQIWNWRQKKLIRTLSGHVLSSVDGLEFNSKSDLLSCSGDMSVKVWNWQNGDLKMILGDGLFQAKFERFLSLAILMTLIAGFWGVIRSSENKCSSFIILFILSIWSLGLFLILYFAKKYLVKYSNAIAWVSTIISGLLFITVYLSLLSLFTIPIALFFEYIQVKSQKKDSYLPILINLIFCAIICSFMR